MLKAFLIRVRNVAVWATLGAGIGGSVAALWAVLLVRGSLIDAPLLVDGVVVFGVSGLVVGAILSFFLAVLVDKMRALVSIGSGILSGMGTGILIPFVILIFASRAWPSPRPYPGVFVTTDEALGASGWHYRTRTYTTTLSIDYLQQYYDEQMSHYCLDEWQFKNSDNPGYADCLEASCSICPETDVDPQYFIVYLCSANETQIEVIQEDMWDFD